MKTIRVKDIVIGEGKPKVCIPIMGKDECEIKEALFHASAYTFDIIEWRIDHLEDTSIENVIKMGKMIQENNKKHILLFTFRSKKEGGEKDITPQEYVSLNKAIIENELCEMIDVEMFMGEDVSNILCDLAHTKGIYVVGSNHDFTNTPNEEELIRRFVYMQDRNVDVCKLAMMPNSKEDVYTVMRATYKAKKDFVNVPLVSMSMGEIGKCSRILGELFGSSITFGSIGKTSAPGQMEVCELNEKLEYVSTYKEEAVKKFME